MKGRYSADELERARRIADAVRGLQSNQDLPDNVGGREGYVVGAVATLVIMSLASIAWWFLREPQTNRIPSMTTSTQRAEERNHSSSTSNAMPTQTSGPRLTPAAPQRAAPEKFNPYVTRTTPVRTMAPSRSTPNTSPVSFTMDTHGRIAANHAENYFENEYVLGSSELEVRTVTATPISSAPVASVCASVEAVNCNPSQPSPFGSTCTYSSWFVVSRSGRANTTWCMPRKPGR